MWVMRATAASLCCLAAAAGTPSPRAASSAACHPAVRTGVLPVWARAGFSDPRPRMPHVLGRSGRIVAIVFGFPLLAPPAKNRSNKILWVSRRPVKPLSDLRIRAQRMQGTRPVGRPVTRRVPGGPGPSLVDLPAAGCWRLALRWSGRSDTLDLRYEPGG
jgi:hypothetical protein